MGQKFCRVFIWKRFEHPNLLPFFGTEETSHHPAMVSERMGHGTTVMDFVNAFPETNRLKLVRVFPDARGSTP